MSRWTPHGPLALLFALSPLITACGSTASSQATVRVASPPRAKVTEAWPAPRRIAERSLALCALATRGFLDAHRPIGAEAAHEQLLDFVRTHELGSALEASEATALHAPLGELESDAIVDATWKLEGVAVLAWSLGAFDLPPHDRPVDGMRLCTAIGFLARPRPLLLDLPRRRPAEEILALHGEVAGQFARLSESSEGSDESIEGSVARERGRALDWLVGGRLVALRSRS